MNWDWKQQLKANEYANCANCNRTLKVDHYSGTPKVDTPPEKIRRWENKQCYDYSIHCPSCDFYTIAIHVGR